MYEKIIKRSLDLAAALLLLVFLSPLFIIIALMIKTDDGGSVFFKQDRLGKKGQIFKLWKFRTMVMNAENIGTKLSTASNDPRITRLGKILRKTSIDELPQLINIFLGQMSLIGPRPGPPSHLAKYSEEEKRRLDVLPGISGWAQVNGRNTLTWEERISKDIWYVDNMSFLLDLKIFFKTIKTVLLAEGVYSGRNDSKISDYYSNNKE